MQPPPPAPNFVVFLEPAPVTGPRAEADDAKLFEVHTGMLSMVVLLNHYCFGLGMICL